jgi:cell division protein ZapA
MKQLEVTIMGQSYILACPEGRETQLLEAVANVDSEMCAIRDAGKVKARERIAVLAALNLAYTAAESPTTARLQEASAAHDLPADPAVDVAGLITRLDAALGSDGRLL